MVRGTFANVRLRNLLVPESEGTVTVHLPSGEETSIFEAAERYRDDGVPLIVLAGKEYGSGSSRDWAAKGPSLLGVRAAIAESFERIHRSNLLMMGIVPLQFAAGRLGGVARLDRPRDVRRRGARGGRRPRGIGHGHARTTGEPVRFRCRVRLDTPREREYVRHGGILRFVLRRLLAA